MSVIKRRKKRSDDESRWSEHREGEHFSNDEESHTMWKSEQIKKILKKMGLC